MTKICKFCGEEFEARDNRTLYCSDECKHEAYKKYQREYKQNYVPLDKRAVKTITRICPICGKEFTTSRYNKTYCSNECYKVQAAIRDAARTPNKAPAPRKKKKINSKGISFDKLSPEEKFFYGRTQQKAYANELKVIIPVGLISYKDRKECKC